MDGDLRLWPLWPAVTGDMLLRPSYPSSPMPHYISLDQIKAYIGAGGSSDTIDGDFTVTGGDIGNLNSLFTDYGAHVVRLSDRLFVGAAAAVAAGNHANSPGNWLSQLTNLNYTGEWSQSVILSTVGTLALTVGSRTSDSQTATGGTTGAAIGISGYGINDDTSAAGPFPNPAAWGGYFEARRSAGVTGSTVGVEIDIGNYGSTYDVTPHLISGPGQTLGLSIAAGGASAPNPVSAGLVFIDNVAKFRKGIIFHDTALDNSVGGGGRGVAMELFTGQSFRWLDINDAVQTEVYGTAGGLSVSGGMKVGNPSGGFMGAGSVNAQALYINGVAAGGGGGGAASISIGDAPPASPTQGTGWWDSAGGQLYLWYNDGNSSQWVPASNMPGPQGATGATGATGPNWTVGSGLTLTGSTLSLTTPALPLTGGTLTGPATIATAGDAVLNLQKASGAFSNNILAFTGATPRWLVQFGNEALESGSNAGSDFGIHRYSDAGTYVGQVLSIVRATGTTTFSGATVVSGSALLNGQVMVANASPIDATGFHVQQNIAASASSVMITATTIDTTIYHHIFRNATGQVGAIATNAAATTYATSSDGRLKTDECLAADLTALRDTKIWDFNWKSDGSRGRGVIAQEQEAIFPEMIVRPPDDMPDTPWMADYSKLVPDLVVGWQAHEAEIKTLRQQLDDALAKLDALEAKR